MVFDWNRTAPAALSASLLLSTTVAWAAPDDARETTRQQFQAGIAYIDDPNGPRYEEALEAFTRAHAASKSAKILNNIGLCAMNLERDGEAIAAYEQYLRETGSEVSPKAKKQVEMDIATLKASLVTLSIRTAPEKMSLVDERVNSKGARIINRYQIAGGTASLGIHPGHHKIVATAAGYEPMEWEFDAPATSSHEHLFQLKPAGGSKATAEPSSVPTAANTPVVAEPPQSSSPRIPTSVYVGAAATGVFAVTATVTGVMALSKQSSLDEAKSRGDRSAADGASDSGKTLAIVTDVALGAAVVSAGVTTYLFFASRKSSEKQATASSLEVSPVVGQRQVGLSVFSRF